MRCIAIAAALSVAVAFAAPLPEEGLETVYVDRYEHGGCGVGAVW